MSTIDSHMTRRTMLRGVGVAMALPCLESLPAFGGESATAFPKRFAALFMGNGVNPNHWWAKGAGAEMRSTLGIAVFSGMSTVVDPGSPTGWCCLWDAGVCFAQKTQTC